MNSKIFALASFAGFAVASSASAAFTGLTIEAVDAGAPAGLQTWRVYANFDDNAGLITAVGDELDDVMLTVDLSSGEFFNSAFGGDLPPPSAFIPAIPELGWDTFVTIGTTDEAAPVTGGAPGFATQAGGMTGSFSLSDTGWFIAGFPPQGEANGNNQVLLAQFTADEGADITGENWRVSGLAVAGDTSSAFDEFVGFSTIAIPTPGALALLGLAGVCSARRRRG